MDKGNDKLLQLKLGELFEEHFGGLGERPFVVRASAPGRLELAGNHTDHQGGRVISAALDRHVFALAAPNGGRAIRAYLDGFGEMALDLCEAGAFDPHPEEFGSSLALIRGMLAAYAEGGGRVEGFDLVVDADLPAGAGLSSSAAFEMLIGAVVRALDADARDVSADAVFPCEEDRLGMALEGARIEREFFGKSCGAQDQIASAFGGIVFMDFADKLPQVRRVSFDFAEAGYQPILIDSGVDHSRYPEDYESVPADMRKVAQFLGAERLGDVSEEEFIAQRGEIAERLGIDRLLRAEHYYGETERVLSQYEALNCGDFDYFLALANGSGRSSERLLKNVVPSRIDAADEMAQLPQRILDECGRRLAYTGAWRIHGGGFGGSILAIVPAEGADAFIREMDGELGRSACMPVNVAEAGASARREMCSQ